MQRLRATLVLLAATTPAAGQWLSLATPNIPRTPDGKPNLTAPAPRTADGHPDLNGLWIPRATNGDIFDIAKFQPWARDLRDERESTFFQAEPGQLCLPLGPGTLLNAGMRRIVQSPAFVAILGEDLTYRQIFVDGRTLETNPNPSWMGYSVGRWDGDTFVVESNGFNDKTWLHNRGLPHTEKLRVTERYRRSDFGHIELSVTYVDAEALAAPVHAVIALELVADDEMLEVVCNEATEGRKHYGGEISEAHSTTVDVAPAILAQYVGTYRGYWVDRLTTVAVTLEDGVLFSLRNNREKSRLLPQSDHTFACTCGLAYIFHAASGGMASEVEEVHVSGKWTFARLP